MLSRLCPHSWRQKWGHLKRSPVLSMVAGSLHMLSGVRKTVILLVRSAMKVLNLMSHRRQYLWLLLGTGAGTPCWRSGRPCLSGKPVIKAGSSTALGAGQSLRACAGRRPLADRAWMLLTRHRGGSFGEAVLGGASRAVQRPCGGLGACPHQAVHQVED